MSDALSAFIDVAGLIAVPLLVLSILFHAITDHEDDANG